MGIIQNIQTNISKLSGKLEVIEEKVDHLLERGLDRTDDKSNGVRKSKTASGENIIDEGKRSIHPIFWWKCRRGFLGRWNIQDVVLIKLRLWITLEIIMKI